MKDVTYLLILMFKMTNYDWLGFKVSRVDDYTFHHLDKDEDGGEYTLENGAVLSKTSHRYLHFIEIVDYDIYVELNNILREINKQGYLPTVEQSKRIDKLLLNFENSKKNYQRKFQKQIYTTNQRLKLQLKYQERKPRKK